MPSATLHRPRRNPEAAAAPRPGGRWLDDPEVVLMLRARDGDTAAFTTLADRYQPRVFGYFCKQVRDRAEAEDLTQEVFLRLYRARARYQPKARFATWVFHVTQNVARNALRSRRRRPCVQLGPPAAAEAALPEALLTDHGDSPTRPLERDELAGVVRGAVATLGGRQRVAVVMHQFEERSYAEVAFKLDMTPKAAKSLLYRARNQLRDVLAGFMQ
jgi:RNA polymerase sigma-70 factor (ECF subfamily)